LCTFVALMGVAGDGGPSNLRRRARREQRRQVESTTPRPPHADRAWAVGTTRQGWKGREILSRMLAEDLTLVTGNWKDFRPMLKREEVHPGAISLPEVPRADQLRLFTAALDHIERSTPPLDMINTVLNVAEDGTIDAREIP
jgi:hypothetical protein